MLNEKKEKILKQPICCIKKVKPVNEQQQVLHL